MLLAQLAAIVVLAILHAAITWAPKGTYHRLIVSLVDVDSETNLPTWFSSIQWMLLTLTLAAIAVLAHAMRRSRLVIALWTLCAAAALYFSADEVAMFHERFGTILEEALQDAPAGSPLRALFDLNLTSYYWVMAYLPFVVPALIGGAIFFWKELGGNRRAALLGMFVFIYGAVGLDWVEGRYGTDAHTEIVLQIASRRIGFDILLLEESLEMLGVSLALYALLLHLSFLAAGTLDAPACKPGGLWSNGGKS